MGPEFEPSPLDNLRALSQRMIHLKEEETRLNNELSGIKEQINKLELELIPDTFDSLGIDEIKLSNGMKLKVSQMYVANISKTRLEEAHQWLRDHDAGDLIKTQLILDANLEGVLKKLEIEFGRDEKVHNQTLRKFVREKLEAGEEIPHDLFGVHTLKRAELK